jgi:hypothetical protein
MKNIFVLPTDKPSRLFELVGDLYLDSEMGLDGKRNRHIYIISDEEIKERDWALDLCKDLGLKYQPFKVDKATLKYANQECKKIILTTDQDLIKDGVQAIDEEFLKWFIENPSCEFVEFNAYPIGPNGNIIGTNRPYPFDGLISNFRIEYKIIIPKEEQRQHIISIMKEDEELGLYEESKQETLEEAAEKYANKKGSIPTTELEDAIFKQGFIDGAKWQSERMFEIMDAYVNDVMGGCNLRAKDWFSQFKKK